MGITIYCKKDPSYSMDMGYGGFFRLRETVSACQGGEWHEHYLKRMGESIRYEKYPSSWYKCYDTKTDIMVRKKKISIKFVDFLMQSDCEGSIHYGACKVLLKVIGDYDDDIFYGYVSHGENGKFHRFKEILERCVQLKCDMKWD